MEQRVLSHVRFERVVIPDHPIQRGGVLIAEVHFVIAVDLRMRAEDMPRQAGLGAHVAQQEDAGEGSGMAFRQSVHAGIIPAISLNKRGPFSIANL